ncbi:MAG: DsbA family protein [Gammaproteobacteria bacterium]|nr:DsbA family protein [Gammaproteobacteria bacterium]MDH5799660.1 DsbA family protein [Gammaproteobacteria bacterium]
MADKKDLKTNSNDVADFLGKVAALPVVKKAVSRGRLLFALDATASREPTWDQACHIQGQMFTQTQALGGLEVQLCFYRGFSEFQASAWWRDGTDLLRCMRAVFCEGGHTQIARVLRHTIKETAKSRVNALVFVGDCVEESADELYQLAGELGLHGVPVFVFHEGNDLHAAHVLRQIARLSRGAYCPFDSGSAQQLQQLLSAVAVYAAGGFAALEAFNQRHGSDVLKLGRKP